MRAGAAYSARSVRTPPAGPRSRTRAMGREAACEVRFAGRASRGKPHLDSKELRFSGDFRLKIPFREMREVAARDGDLEISFPGGVATFVLGRQAQAWALGIRSPRSRLDKLGVKSGSRVCVLGIRDADFLRELKERAADVSVRSPGKDRDLIFAGMDKKADLARLEKLRRCIRPAGAIWVVRPKGPQGLSEDDIRAHGPRAGLVDVKVVSFSPALSALKLVIPLSSR